MSYLDSAGPAYKNLSPEDVEHLLTRSADNKGYLGHSDSTGWGDLNAGRVLQSVNKGCNELVHLGKGADPSNIISRPIKFYTPIKLAERYTNPLGQTFDTITYICNVVKVSNRISQHLDTNFVITDYWPRPSSTTFLPCYDSVAHTLSPFEHLYIDSISPTSVTVSGYYYYAFRATDTTYLGNWGEYQNIVADSMRFDYTLLLNNPTVNCHPVDTAKTGIKNLTNSIQVSFYPNPVDEAGILQIYSDAETKGTISIIDQQGREIETIYTGGIANGGTIYNINTKALASGLYMVVVISGEGTKVIKFLKYESN